MKIAVLGLGYVGCTAIGCITSQGHEVVGIDVSAAKVVALNNGASPVFEPGLDVLIAQARRDGLLSAYTDIGDRLDACDIAIVCVGTPSAANGAHDMRFIVQVSRQIAQAIGRDRARPLTVVFRSTMRPGSTEHLILPIFRSVLGDDTDRLVELVYNPEFLREASAINDYFHPPKIVIGTVGGQHSAAMAALHRGIEAPVFEVGIREAELTKFVDNSWHAVKVAFANEIGRVCQTLGISAREVHRIFVADTKLNISPYYTRPGAAFGGSCLPKDVRALQNIAEDVGANTHLVDSLIRSNEAHKHFQFQRAVQDLARGSRVLLVGLSFKTETDDLRESPAVDMARKLLDAGYELKIYDPLLKPESLIGQNLGYAYAHLPSIDSLLVDKHEAEGGGYDLIIATNRLVDDLAFADVPIVDLSVIP